MIKHLMNKNILAIVYLSATYKFLMRYYFFLFCFLCMISGLKAQSGNNQMGIGADLGIPVGDLGRSTRLAPGVSLKALYGLGMYGQAGITASYLNFSARKNTRFKTSSSVIPLLATYRQHLDNIYLEPQVGASFIRSKIEGENIATLDQSAVYFAWAVGVGYKLQDIDLSLRYQTASKNGGSRGFIGLRAGYNFNL